MRERYFVRARDDSVVLGSGTVVAVELRAARDGDVEVIAEVLVRSRAVFLPYAPSPHSLEETIAWVRGVLVPSGGVTVAVEGERVIGVLAVDVREDIGWIDQLYVAPEHVGHGAGTALLAHALRSLPARVRLHTFQANVRSRHFYERHGFVAIACSDGSGNEERCPDVLYERVARAELAPAER